MYKKCCCFYTCLHVETLQQLNYVVFLFAHKKIYRRNVFSQQNKAKKQRMIDRIDDESHVSSQFWNTLNRKNKREKCAQMCSMWLYFIDALFIVEQVFPSVFHQQCSFRCGLYICRMFCLNLAIKWIENGSI